MRDIRWTSQAKLDYNEVLTYYSGLDMQSAASHLMDRVDQVLDLIQKMPLMYQPVPELPSIRKAPLSHRFNLYYCVVEDSIVVVGIRVLFASQ